MKNQVVAIGTALILPVSAFAANPIVLTSAVTDAQAYGLEAYTSFAPVMLALTVAGVAWKYGKRILSRV